MTGQSSRETEVSWRKKHLCCLNGVLVDARIEAGHGKNRCNLFKSNWTIHVESKKCLYLKFTFFESLVLKKSEIEKQLYLRMSIT